MTTNDAAEDYAAIYLNGGGDPSFAQIDAFLRTHFNARAVYLSDDTNDAAERLPWKDQPPADKVRRGIKAWVTDPVANQAMRDYLDAALAAAKEEGEKNILAQHADHDAKVRRATVERIGRGIPSAPPSHLTDAGRRGWHEAWAAMRAVIDAEAER